MGSVGCDIEEISRFQGCPPAFYAKIFTPKEIEYCTARTNPAQHFAARFCAKEAVVKALHGMGVKEIHYKDIEIAKNGNIPLVRIGKLPRMEISVSLSHARGFAMAVAMIKK